MPWSPAPFFFLAFFLLGIDAHGDIGRLTVQQHFDVCAVVREAVLVVADVLDDIARDLRDLLTIDDSLRTVLLEQRSLATAFAGDHDLVGGGEGLAAQARVDEAVVGDSKLDVVREEGVEDCV